MTEPTHEGETVYMTDAAGNPVDDAAKAMMIEVVSPDGVHTILTHKDSTKDPFAGKR